MKDEVQGTAIAAINFSIEKIGDHYDRLEFLKAWRDGLTDSEWPEFREYCTPTPIAASSEAGTGGIESILQRLEQKFAPDAVTSPYYPGHRITRMEKKRARARLVVESIVALRSALSAPVGEPVAWQFMASDDVVLSTTADKRVVKQWEQSGYHVRPLYTYPPAPAVGGGRGYEKPETAAQKLAMDAANAILSLLSGQGERKSKS